MYELEKIRLKSSDVPLYYLKDCIPEMQVSFFKHELESLSREYILRGLFLLYGKKKPKKPKHRPDDVRLKLALDKYNPTSNATRNKLESLIESGILDQDKFLHEFKNLARNQTQTFFYTFVVPAIDARMNELRTIVSDLTCDDRFGQVTTNLLCDYLGANIKDVPLDWILEQFHRNDQLPARFGRSFQVQSAHLSIASYYNSENLSAKERACGLINYFLVRGCPCEDIQVFLNHVSSLNASVEQKEVMQWINQHIKDPDLLLNFQLDVPQRHKSMRLFLTQMDLLGQLDTYGSPHFFYVYTVQALDERKNRFTPIKVLTYELPVYEQILYPELVPLFNFEQFDRNGYAQNSKVDFDDTHLRQYLQQRYREQNKFFSLWQAGEDGTDINIMRLQRWLKYNFLEHYDEMLAQSGINMVEDPDKDANVKMDPKGYEIFYRFHPHYRQVYRELSAQAFAEMRSEDYPLLQFVLTSSLCSPIEDLVKQTFPHACVQIVPCYDLNFVQDYVNNNRVDGKDLPLIDDVFSNATSYRDSVERLRSWIAQWSEQAPYQVGAYCLQCYQQHMGASFFKLPVSVRRLIASPEVFIGMYQELKIKLSTFACDAKSFKEMMNFSLRVAEINGDDVCYNFYEVKSELITGLDTRQRNLNRDSNSAISDVAMEEKKAISKEVSEVANKVASAISSAAETTSSEITSAIEIASQAANASNEAAMLAKDGVESEIAEDQANNNEADFQIAEGVSQDSEPINHGDELEPATQTVKKTLQLKVHKDPVTSIKESSLLSQSKLAIAAKNVLVPEHSSDGPLKQLMDKVSNANFARYGYNIFKGSKK